MELSGQMLAYNPKDGLLPGDENFRVWESREFAISSAFSLSVFKALDSMGSVFVYSGLIDQKVSAPLVFAVAPETLEAASVALVPKESSSHAIP